MTRSPDDAIDRALVALVDSLARILIPLEITPDRLAQIVRSSFVKTAATEARKRSSGRPHIAKIAAVTGLTRAEVKRIVAGNYQTNDSTVEVLPRPLRVLAAWTTSKEYSERGKPKRLKITGPAPSFESLCRQFSGDIPYRVVLNELVRTSRIAANKTGTAVSILTKNWRSRNVGRREISLSFVAGFIDAALDHDSVLVRRKQDVNTATSLSVPYVERAVSGRVIEMLDQMPMLFPKTRSRKRHSVSVYALVARNARRAKP